MTFLRTVDPPDGMEWRLFECSGDGEDECDYAYVAPSWETSGPLDHCPKCGSYLSFYGGGEPHMVVKPLKDGKWADAVLGPVPEEGEP